MTDEDVYSDMIEKNVGGYDRTARAVLAVFAAVVGVAAVAGVGAVGETVGVAGGIVALLVAAGLGFNVVTQRCMGNAVLGIDSCEVESDG